MGGIDEFEPEVARLRQSRPFMDFLTQRSRDHEGSLSLEELEREIAEAVAREESATNDKIISVTLVYGLGVVLGRLVSRRNNPPA
jgi:hypothetical protein